MKAISLWQPWASLIPWGYKKHETRSWYTSYRGDLLICAAKKKSQNQRDSYEWIMDEHSKFPIYPKWETLPFGCAIAIVNLSDCIKMTNEFIKQQSKCERDCGDWQVGRFAWKFEDIRPVENIPITGKQGLFDVDYSINQ